MKQDHKIFISELKGFESQTIALQGWAYLIRSSGKISFLVLRDGSGYCQCVLSKDFSSSQALEAFSLLSPETSVEVIGKIKKWKQDFEMEVQDLKIISKSEDYPITKKAHGTDFLMSHRHLWLRSKKQGAIMKIRNEIIQQSHQFFQQESFLQIDAPLLTPNSCEGTSSVFSVDFFDKDQVYLSQSGQLYMEAAAAAYGKVYCFGPTFRAEKSSTRRHLLEFWMIEPEMAFYNYSQAMEVAERFVEFVVQNTLKNRKEELKILERDIQFLEKIQAPFPKITYEKACDIIKEEAPDFQAGKDLGGGEETLISQKFDKPVFIHHYPADIKAFYMKEDPENQKLSLSFDLLATEGYGEVIGGGQREDCLKTLEAKIKEHQLNAEDFKWYLDLRRYGSFTHSGFGLGLERLVVWICGLDHVRQSIPFPRVYGRSFFENS